MRGTGKQAVEAADRGPSLPPFPSDQAPRTGRELAVFLCGPVSKVVPESLFFDLVELDALESPGEHKLQNQANQNSWPPADWRGAVGCCWGHIVGLSLTDWRLGLFHVTVTGYLRLSHLFKHADSFLQL